MKPDLHPEAHHRTQTSQVGEGGGESEGEPEPMERQGARDDGFGLHWLGDKEWDNEQA
jgi:hypothetical protein